MINGILPSEEDKLGELIKIYRKKYIRTSQEIVDKIFSENANFIQTIKNKQVSCTIKRLRELIWNEYLKDEAKFNTALMSELHKSLKTPKAILDNLVSDGIVGLSKDKLLSKIREVCGAYAGSIFPYAYKISLSTTNSRRSRAGKTFESIIYKIYEVLHYEFDSQAKVGRKIFKAQDLGKKVDSIIPSIACFEEKRDKTIIGTMKTSLRERWQEVAEEIARINIPTIHLLTVDENISVSKAQEMKTHNIIIVTYDWVSDSGKISSMKNVISFEDYLFTEIPSVLKFWQSSK
ncbi:MAG: type II restriction endonuclease [SAR324 cluster bacterium]|nr:type II restriction endonuclease [SAR324 cluster bacterium]